MLEKVFNNSTILNEFSIYIDDVEIPSEDVISLEMTQKFYDLKFTGLLKISDTYDINQRVNINGKNRIKISLKDFAGTLYTKTFLIVGVKRTQHEERFNVIDFALQDEISYILENTYISKGFSDTSVSAFQTYLTHLGIDDIIVKDEMTYEINDTTSVRDFVVPQHISVLDFFTRLFIEENIRVWQDKFAFHVSSVIPSNLKVQQFQNENIIFSNHTLNNEYLFKVHEFIDTKFPVRELNIKRPITRNYRYNYNKELVHNTKNLADVYKNLAMNAANNSDLQHTIGEKFITQSFFSDGNQEFDLFNTYMDNSTFSVIVPGVFETNQVGTVVEIEMKGNNIYSETQLSGDKISSGKYFVTEIKDKIIGGKYINKLRLNRLDTQ